MAEGEITINVAKLKGKKLLVCTPMYGGLGNTMYITSMLQLQDMCAKHGIGMSHCFMMNESLIDRGRNGLAHEFLNGDSDYMIFIDADIQFRPEDVLAMLTYEKELICAPYPKKHINWPIIIEAMKAGITDPPTLEKLVGEYVFTPLEEDSKLAEVIEVSEAGTGLMIIHRSVFEKMKAAFPENYYISDSSQDVLSGIKKEMHAFFRTDIKNNRYLSEDYYFCHKWREIGGKVWLFPWALTTHFGTYGFQGSVGHLIDTMRRIEFARSKNTPSKIEIRTFKETPKKKGKKK
jgi:hypothetical protein